MVGIAAFFALSACAASSKNPVTAGAPAASGTQVVVDDPLDGKTAGEQSGGRFTSEGYAPGKGAGHILYKLPATVREGFAEFEFKGMETAKGSDFDNGFFAMYDGRGHEEPIKYFNAFKQNYYRWNVHFRTDKGAMKSVISMAKPTPERLAATKAEFPEKGRDFSTEPTGEKVEFDPGRWYKLRVEWKDRTYSVTLDGKKVWSVTGPYDYAPVDHRAWLGSAPGKDSKYLSFFDNIVYRNFRLVAYATGQAPAAAAAAATSAAAVAGH